jgi:tyrosyl-tRNA synthetase
LGGGTTKIGDPSGKDIARPLLTDEIINENQNSIKTIFQKFLKFGNKDNDALLVDNSLWLEDLNYISFLRDFGQSFSINKLMNLDSVKLRLEREQNLSFLEFNYSLLQAFDFLKLNEKYNCKLQMGGSDQWGNIVTGLELVRKKLSKQAFGLTSPLLTTNSGAKMGKSADGAIWLNENQLSNWDFWQYWRNTEDLDVIKFLKLFTELEMSEIKKLEKLEGAEINEAKIVLANEVTGLCRGKEEAQKICLTANNTFNKKNDDDDGLPNAKVTSSTILILDALNILNFTKSKGEGRRLIRGNAIKVNDVLIQDEHFIVSKQNFQTGKVKISSGRKKHGILIFD